jgi:hypothetical protein
MPLISRSQALHPALLCHVSCQSPEAPLLFYFPLLLITIARDGRRRSQAGIDDRAQDGPIIPRPRTEGLCGVSTEYWRDYRER